MGFHLFPLSRDGRCGFPEVRELSSVQFSFFAVPPRSLHHRLDGRLRSPRSTQVHLPRRADAACARCGACASIGCCIARMRRAFQQPSTYGVDRRGHSALCTQARRHTFGTYLLPRPPFARFTLPSFIVTLAGFCRASGETPPRQSRRPVDLSSQPQALRCPRHDLTSLSHRTHPSGPVGLKLHRTVHSMAFVVPILCPHPRSRFSAEMHPNMQVLTTAARPAEMHPGMQVLTTAPGTR